MLTRSQYILSDANLLCQLHEGTIEFMKWVQDAHKFHVPKQLYQTKGLYWRQHCVDLKEMFASSTFFHPSVRGAESVVRAFEYGSKPHEDFQKTLNYAHAIDRHVRYFVSIVGGIDKLPFSPTQRVTLRVQPCGQWSETATATFYQHYRFGYLKGGHGRKLVKEVGKENVELAYGIVEQMSFQVPTTAYISVIIPQACEVDALQLQGRESLVWYENEGNDRIHLAPGVLETANV